MDDRSVAHVEHGVSVRLVLEPVDDEVAGAKRFEKLLLDRRLFRVGLAARDLVMEDAGLVVDLDERFCLVIADVIVQREIIDILREDAADGIARVLRGVVLRSADVLLPAVEVPGVRVHHQGIVVLHAVAAREHRLGIGDQRLLRRRQGFAFRESRRDRQKKENGEQRRKKFFHVADLPSLSVFSMRMQSKVSPWMTFVSVTA